MSKTRDRMTLKSFMTLMDSCADVKINGAFIARANLRASRSMSSCSSGGSATNESYFVPTSNAKAVRFRPRHWRYLRAPTRSRPREDRSCSFLPRWTARVVLSKPRRDVRTDAREISARSAVPLFYRSQRALPRQIKHEEDRARVVAHERQHRQELAVAAEVPDTERDLRVAERDGFFHEVDALRATDR